MATETIVSREKLREEFLKIVSKSRPAGTGQVTVSGVPVPPLMQGDMAQDAATDYDRAEAERNNLALLWIRRAAHAEAFARALDVELEKWRQREASIAEMERELEFYRAGG